jgi:hypothetical protein
MDFYDVLTKLVENTVIGEPNQKAALEVIANLKGVNAFGTVVAGTISESEGTPHVHQKETRWDEMNASKVADFCRTCGARMSRPYDPPFTGRKW